MPPCALPEQPSATRRTGQSALGPGRQLLPYNVPVLEGVSAITVLSAGVASLCQAGSRVVLALAPSIPATRSVDRATTLRTRCGSETHSVTGQTLGGHTQAGRLRLGHACVCRWLWRLNDLVRLLRRRGACQYVSRGKVSQALDTACWQVAVADSIGFFVMLSVLGWHPRPTTQKSTGAGHPI